MNTAAIVPSAGYLGGSPEDEWIPSVPGHFAPTFGIGQRKGLVGRWTFDDVVDTRVQDSVGINHANDGTGLFHLVVDAQGEQAMGPPNSPPPPSASPFPPQPDPSAIPVGGFTGVTPKDRALDQENFSVSLRVKPSTAAWRTPHSCLLVYNAQNAGSNWTISMDENGHVYAQSGSVGQGNLQTLNPNPAITIRDDRWHEVTLTYNADTGTAKLYVDINATGEAQWNLRPAGRPTLTGFVFGSNLQDYSSPGLLDDIRFWSYVLNETN